MGRRYTFGLSTDLSVEENWPGFDSNGNGKRQTNGRRWVLIILYGGYVRFINPDV